MSLPADPFGRVVHPLQADDYFERRHRVGMMDDVSESLLARRLPGAEAGAFVASAIQAWLTEGGDLVGKFLKVRPRRGDKRTAQVLYRERASERRERSARLHRDDDGGPSEF